MSSALITNIRQLVSVRDTKEALRGQALAELPVLENAWIQIEDGIIARFGLMDMLKSVPHRLSTVLDAKGAMILPCWCDSHTHLVFAGSREAEFVDKIKGRSYAEIAAAGGGILNSAKKLMDASEDSLFNDACGRLDEISKQGTGAIEIKSGYGLSVNGELKMLRVIKRLKAKSNLEIRATFLGAHSFPPEYKEDHQGYIDMIINEMLPVIAREKLADYIDVFCETGFFSPAEMETICRAGLVHGLKPKLHVNQLNSIGGIEKGIELNAVSMDHLETLTEEDIKLLGNLNGNNKWKGMSTLLPSAAFFLRMPYPPARRLIDEGSAVALASDYNPGSSPSGNMHLVLAMSCIQMQMLPEEAINSATINGAYAMGLENEVGSIQVGKKANLIFLKPIPSVAFIPYSFGTNLIDKVMIKGKFI